MTAIAAHALDVRLGPVGLVIVMVTGLVVGAALKGWKCWLEHMTIRYGMDHTTDAKADEVIAFAELARAFTAPAEGSHRWLRRGSRTTKPNASSPAELKSVPSGDIP